MEEEGGGGNVKRKLDNHISQLELRRWRPVLLFGWMDNVVVVGSVSHSPL